MSFLRSQLPLDALMGQAQLLGQMQQTALRDPTPATGTEVESFRAQLLQQMMGACDRSSLAMNDAEGQIFPPASPWGGLPSIGNPVLGDTPTVPPAAHGNAPTTPARHLHHATHHAHRTHHPAHPSAPAQSAPLVVSLPDPGAAPTKPLAAKAAAHPPSAADGFMEKLGGLARATAEGLGLSPHLLLAQAALETGWGRKAIKDEAGGESYNLFGIKADKHWTGKTVDVSTIEYINGQPQKKVESFRAYGSYAESFSDYARLIKHRYGEAMAHGATAEGFGRALQAKGYATDPNYAQKIARVAQSVAYRLATGPARSSEVG